MSVPQGHENSAAGHAAAVSLQSGTAAGGGRRSPAQVLRFARVPEMNGAEFLHGRFSAFNFAPHTHDRTCLCLVERGTIVINQPRSEAAASRGEFSMLQADRVHWGGNARPEGWTIRTFYLDPQEMAVATDLLFDETPPGRRHDADFLRVVARDPALADTFLRAEAAMTTPDGAGLPREALFAELIERWLTAHAGALPDRVPPSPHEPQAVRRARAHLDAHLDAPVSLKELAAEARLSPFRLCRAFRSSVGMPPHAYHLDRRIRHALDLLRAGEPIADTALACGFTDQAHLTRVFRRLTGMTPGAFRA